MADAGSKALHQVRTGISDVLDGYRTLSERAEPEIQPVVQTLNDMHHRHASDLDAKLVSLGEAADDDGSIRGAINKAAVALRDWVTISTRTPCRSSATVRRS